MKYNLLQDQQRNLGLPGGKWEERAAFPLAVLPVIFQIDTLPFIEMELTPLPNR